MAHPHAKGLQNGFGPWNSLSPQEQMLKFQNKKSNKPARANLLP
jgi:hypothetical protein